jgi:hypothetical protein
MKHKYLLPVHLAGLLGVAAASVGEGTNGGDATVCLVQALTVLLAAGVVAWRRRTTVGLVITAWQSLGLFAMSFVADNLRSGDTALVASTIGYVAALAVAILSGALEVLGRRHSAPADPQRADKRADKEVA